MRIIVLTLLISSIAIASLSPWTTLIWFQDNDVLVSVCPTIDDGTLAVGATSLMDLNSESSVHAVKFDHLGNVQWNGLSFSFGSRPFNAAYSVCQSKVYRDTYVMTGMTGYSYDVTGGQGFLLKIDDDGCVLDSELIGDTYSCRDIVATSDGSFYITGIHTECVGTVYIPPAFLSRYSSDLTEEARITIGPITGSTSPYDYSEGLCVLEMDNDRILVGGTYHEEFGFIGLYEFNSPCSFVELDFLWFWSTHSAVVDLARVGNTAYAIACPPDVWHHQGAGASSTYLLEISVAGDNITITDQEEIEPVANHDFWPTALVKWGNKLVLAGKTNEQDEDLILVVTDLQLNYIEEYVYPYGCYWAPAHGRVGLTPVHAFYRTDIVAATAEHDYHDNWDAYAVCERGKRIIPELLLPLFEQTARLAISTNVSSQRLSIRVEGAAGNCEAIDIYSMSGRLVGQIPFQGMDTNEGIVEFEYSFENGLQLGNGVYIARLVADDGTELTDTFVLVH